MYGDRKHNYVVQSAARRAEERYRANRVRPDGDLLWWATTIFAAVLLVLLIAGFGGLPL